MITEAREIVITIRDDKTAKAEKKDKPAKKVSEKEASWNDIKKALPAVAFASQAFSYAKQAVISQAKYQLNRYFAMTDDYQGKQDISNALSLIGTGMSIATATYAGFLMGGAVGAAIGFVGSVGNTLLQAHRIVATQDYQIRQSNAQLAYTMSRRGASLQNGSIGENL